MRARHVYDTEPCSFMLALLKFPFCMTTTQLLVAADGLDVLLRARLVEWAMASGGLAALATAGEGGRGLKFRAWSDVVGDEELLGRVKWARVKAVRRAVEKLYRCYDLDVSRLLDVCRQARVPPAPYECLCPYSLQLAACLIFKTRVFSVPLLTLSPPPPPPPPPLPSNPLTPPALFLPCKRLSFCT